jgi:hypothetical protein
MHQRFRQNVSFLSEDEVHIFSDVHLPPGEYSGWISTARVGYPDHRYELHLSKDELAKCGRLNTANDDARTYNVTELVLRGELLVL